MKSLTKSILFFFLFFVLCSLSSISSAAIPQTMNFQAKLTDKNGAPLSGSYQITLALYDAQTAGNKLWEEAQTAVVSDGIANIVLGSVTPLNIAFDKPYWLEITIGTEKLPQRQPLSSSAYALNSSNAEKLGGVSLSSFLMRASNGNVAIGTTDTNNARLRVAGGDILLDDGYSVRSNVNKGASMLSRSSAGQVTIGSGNTGDSTVITGNGTGVIWVANSQKVGINTTTPAEPLDVNGSAVIRGSYLKIPVVSSDPATPQDGMIWYNTTDSAFKCRQSGNTKKFTVQ